MSIEQPEKSTPPATTVTSTGDQQEPTRLGGDPPISVDRSLLRLGAAFGALGVVLQIITDRLHPHRVDPNDSAAVFREYATSDIWTAVHIGQFAGTLFIVLGLIALSRSLARQSGFSGALGTVGTVTAVLGRGCIRGADGCGWCHAEGSDRRLDWRSQPGGTSSSVSGGRERAVD